MHDPRWGPQLETLRQALAVRPHDPDLLVDYGLALGQAGDWQACLQAIQAAHRLAPNAPEILNILGTVWRRMGRIDLAVAAYHRALELAPDFAEVYNNLGVALQDAGQYVEAVAAYRQGISLRHDLTETHRNLANLLRCLGHYDQAQMHAEKVLAASPESPQAYSLLAGVFLASQNPRAAIDRLRTGLSYAPSDSELHRNLGLALESIGDYVGAARHYGESLARQPDNVMALDGWIHVKQYLCDWKDLTELSQRLIEAVTRPNLGMPTDHLVSPFSFLSLPIATDAHAQRRCAERWVEGQAMLRDSGNPKPLRAAADGRIRLGYLSADYHTHATAALISELIESHDRSAFEVIGYSYGPEDQSASRSRLVRAFDIFRDVKLESHTQIAEQIERDGVHILVDLKGYTQHARTTILACRPAPIQVNFLGYPGTMGARFIDYIVADRFLIPDSVRSAYSERVVYLPGCYQPNDRFLEIDASTPTRQECALPEDSLVFCCFNSHYKISEPIFDVWMKLLGSFPGSVLWLLEGTSESRGNLVEEARRRGIAAERLVFAPRRKHPQHLARHAVADLFLDTFPVNAHTGASEALRMGVPIVTLIGETMVSRVAGSLIKHLGFPEWIAHDIVSYRSIAERFAEDTRYRREQRELLRERVAVSSLYSGRSYARKIERAYREMIRRYASGEATRDLHVEWGDEPET